MKIPETVQKQTEDIAIGSGYMYIKEYEKGSAIPKISEVAIEENRKGYLSGGASIYYTPTIDTYKDDMEEITRKILSGEDIGIKGSIGTFMPDTFGIMAPNSGNYNRQHMIKVPTSILEVLRTSKINIILLSLLRQTEVCPL